MNASRRLACRRGHIPASPQPARLGEVGARATNRRKACIREGRRVTLHPRFSHSHTTQYRLAKLPDETTARQHETGAPDPGLGTTRSQLASLSLMQSYNETTVRRHQPANYVPRRPAPRVVLTCRDTVSPEQTMRQPWDSPRRPKGARTGPPISPTPPFDPARRRCQSPRRPALLPLRKLRVICSHRPAGPRAKPVRPVLTWFQAVSILRWTHGAG
jgi:hypothetical protein